MYPGHHANSSPDKAAVIVAGMGDVLTYAELDARSNRLAQLLWAEGLRRGDHLAVFLENHLRYFEVAWAALRSGLYLTTVNRYLTAPEAGYIVDDCGAQVLVSSRVVHEAASEIPERAPGCRRFLVVDGPPEGASPRFESYEAAIAEHPPEPLAEEPLGEFMLYSSGTTGKLKGIMQSYGNRMAMIRKGLMFPEIKINSGEILIHVGPLTHVSGMLLMPTFFLGATNLILHRLDVELLLETFQRERAHYIMLVPAMINIILAHPKTTQYDLSSMKAIFYGAAPISPPRVQQAIDVFGPILVQGYGMSETTSFVTVLTAADHVEALKNNPARLGSCGRPFFETEVKVVNEEGKEVVPGEMGEITARGADIMQGYYRDPELTRQTIRNGWIHSGDMAKVDEEGFIYIVDRKTEMIISGGFNVYPSEVEQVIYKHPAILEVCVLGVPDEKWGEAIKAVVVLKQGATLTEEELVNHCAQFLGGFKKPRSVDFVTELPKNPNGKIARRLVKEKYWAGKERRVN